MTLPVMSESHVEQSQRYTNSVLLEAAGRIQRQSPFKCHERRHCTLPFVVTDNQMVRWTATASKLTSLCHQQLPVSCHTVLQCNLH